MSGSRRLTSSVTIARSRASASCAISPWPISPPAPVINTTGLRINPYRGMAGQTVTMDAMIASAVSIRQMKAPNR